MRKTALLFLLLLPAFMQTGAQTSIKQLEGSDNYEVTAGKLTMTIDAGFGGRIRSFRYGEKEVLSQSRWPESFGSTFWTSPQKEWNWPPVAEFDKQPYEAELKAGRLVLTSQASERLGLRVRKEFRAGEDERSVAVTYTLVNEGNEGRKVAPWEITRVANGGLVFFDAVADSIWPAGVLRFSQEHGAAWYAADEAPANRKVNADGRGWLAYYGDGLLMVKRFADLGPAEPAPGEAEIQVYVNRGKTYMELESQGAYTLLQPGEEIAWTVVWELETCELPCVPSAELVEKARGKR
mgnify:CR=1 FL=1